jgi:putative oxidoreductase
VNAGAQWLARASALCARIPPGLIALVGRVSIAAVFWKSAQTKVDGFAVDLLDGQFQFGVPRLSDSALALFRDEYRLPLLAPEFAAPLAALGEHVFAAMLLLGLATRFSALALLGMTAVIQLFVYPGAWPTHGTWAAVLLYLVANGPGAISLDHWISRRHSVTGSMRAHQMA